MLTYFAHSRHSVNICWMFHSLTYSFLGPSANKTPIPYSGWRWGCLVNFTSSLPHRERRSRDQACRRYQWVFHERKMIQFQHCSAPSLLLSFCLKYSDCAGGRGGGQGRGQGGWTAKAILFSWGQEHTRTEELQERSLSQMAAPSWPAIPECPNSVFLITWKWPC